jgi:SAM-dependent methyltransferase
MPGGLLFDAAAGVGTQALGLAARGYRVVASDLSVNATLRCHSEAHSRDVRLWHAAADLRALPFRSSFADAAIACDNALPHLLNQGDLLTAIRELARCVRPGGGVLLSVRDYSPKPPGTVEHHPYGERKWRGMTYLAEQEWHWQRDTYSLIIRFRPRDGTAPLEFETTYYAIPVLELLDLMRGAGLLDVQRLDGAFYQPLLLGTVPTPGRVAR